MAPFKPKHVLDIFRDMPGHRGCAETELDQIESELNVTLPTFYRWITILDAHRLYNTEVSFSPSTLHVLRRIVRPYPCRYSSLWPG